MFVYLLKIKNKFPCFYLVGREGFEPSYSNENRFLTTIVFTTKFLCLQSGLSLYLISKIPGIKSLHSEFFSQLGIVISLTVKSSPNQPSFHLTITDKSCNLGFDLKPKTTVCRLQPLGHLPILNFEISCRHIDKSYYKLFINFCQYISKNFL